MSSISGFYINYDFETSTPHIHFPKPFQDITKTIFH